MKSKGIFLTLLLLLAASSAYAGSYTYTFDPVSTFSGTAPTGSLTASLTDVAGGVELVITSSLATGENLDPGNALFLNFDPTKASALSSLSFSLTANTGFSQAASVQTGENLFKADGDGSFDIKFSYESSTKAFTNGQSQTYLISGSSISVNDFIFESYPGGGNGVWLGAVHVQNTPAGAGGSAWVGAQPVPVPAAAWLLGSGLLGLVGIRRKISS